MKILWCPIGFALALAAGSANAQQAAWRLERVGSTAGDMDIQAVGPIAASRAGHLYVTDVKQQIVVYDSTGRRIQTIGRKGEGPLEFLRLSDIAWIADTLVAWDWENARLTYIRPNGTLLRSTSWTSPYRNRLKLLGAGGTSIFARAYGKPTMVPATGGRQAVFHEKHFVAIKDTGTIVEVQGIRDTTTEPISTDCWHDIKGSVYILSDWPGGVGPTNAFTATGGFVALAPDRSRIEWLGADGRVVRRSAPYSRVPVTDAVWRREAKEYLALEGRSGKLTCQKPYVRPTTLPPIRAVVADDEGNVWVEVTAPAGIRLDVYDPAGRLIGSMPAPERVQSIPFVVRARRLYVVEKDADDVTSVGIFRVRR